METVVLKSKVGPTQFTIRPMREHDDGVEYGCHRFDFSLENDCRMKVSSELWETIKDNVFDPQNSLRYRDVIIEL